MVTLGTRRRSRGYFARSRGTGQWSAALQGRSEKKGDTTHDRGTELSETRGQILHFVRGGPFEFEFCDTGLVLCNGHAQRVVWVRYTVQ